MDRRGTTSTTGSTRGARGATVPGVPVVIADDESARVVARRGFAGWLRAARERSGVSLDEIARITKIQRRTLERLEEARFDELPADVFVRGFIRNYARVVGISGEEAITRYDGCGIPPGPVAAARASAPDLRRAAAAPETPRDVDATPGESVRVVAPPPAPVAEAVAAPAPTPAIAKPASSPASKTRKRRGKARRGGGRAERRREVRGPAATPVEADAAAKPELANVEATTEAAVDAVVETVTPVTRAEPAPEEIVLVADEPTDVEVPAREATPARRPVPRAARPSGTQAAVPVGAPVVVIDDEDPERAEQELAERRERAAEKRSFLPASLLDNDRGSRQGGLTLAVIILLIVATITLSYLMRRPSASGEGVTQHESGPRVMLSA